MLKDFLTTDEFHERWKVKTREIMTEFEWRKRRLTIRLKEEEERVSKSEKARKTMNSAAAAIPSPVLGFLRRVCQRHRAIPAAVVQKMPFFLNNAHPTPCASQEALAELREQQRAQKEWDKDEHREKRVASWRDFMNTQKTKKKKGLKSVRVRRSSPSRLFICPCKSRASP